MAPDKIDEYHQKLIDKGIEVSPIMHHDTSITQAADDVYEKVWVSSIYFQDPDGIVLEFAAWQREFSPDLGDRTDHQPATPADKELARISAKAMRAARNASSEDRCSPSD